MAPALAADAWWDGREDEAKEGTHLALLQQLMARRTLVPRDGTYRDLISTGNLRRIDDLEFRNRIVDYFEDVRTRFEIVNKNNSVFVDEMYDGTIMRQGLIIPRSMGDNLELLSPVESMLAEELRGGSVDGPDRLWRLAR